MSGTLHHHLLPNGIDWLQIHRKEHCFCPPVTSWRPLKDTAVWKSLKALNLHPEIATFCVATDVTCSITCCSSTGRNSKSAALHLLSPHGVCTDCCSRSFFRGRTGNIRRRGHRWGVFFSFWEKGEIAGRIDGHTAGDDFERG